MTYPGIIRVTLPIIVFMALVVNGAAAYSIYVGDDSVPNVGDETIIPVVLSSAPDTCIWYFNLNITVDDPSIAEITEVQFPDWVDLTEVEPNPPGTSLYIKGGNLAKTNLTSLDNVVLADIVVKGKAVGQSWITAEQPTVEWEGGILNPEDIFTVSGSITVGGTPEELVADFTGDGTTGPAPLLVQFHDNSTGTPDWWLWDFGDGNTTEGDPDPWWEYTEPGTYDVSLTVYRESEENTTVKTGFVVVTGPEPLVAAFSGTPTSGTAPLNVQFTDSSTGTPTSWLWNFGDGNTSTAQSPSHSFGAVGNYTVNLTVTRDSVTNTTEKINYIKVSSTPVTPLAAAFSGTPTSGTAPLNVQFTDSSTGTPTSWLWNFGDGNTSTTQSPSHSYSTVGIYTVNLTVYRGSESNVTSKANYIQVAQAPLAAAFSGTPTSGTAPLNVQFTDSSTGSPTTWAWNFGDGNTSTAQSPAHSYGAVGTYSVNLTVYRGSESNFTRKANYITVSETPTNLVAAFSGTPRSGNAPLNVQFTDSSTGSPTSWAWDFGDGTTSAVQSPAHSYGASGNFTVNLTVYRGSESNSSRKVDYIQVGSAPVPLAAAFSGTPRSGNAPLNVQFTDSSTGTPTSWAWDFGDGNTSTAQSPAHSYGASGNFTVNLTVYRGSESNSTRKVNYIQVGGSPVEPLVAHFSGIPTSGIVPLTVTFTDSSTGSPTAWAWSFGDGAYNATKSPVHTYTNAGYYTVDLTVYRGSESNTTSKQRYIHAISVIPPYPTYTPVNPDGPKPHPLNPNYTKPTPVNPNYKKPTPVPTPNGTETDQAAVQADSVEPVNGQPSATPFAPSGTSATPVAPEESGENLFVPQGSGTDLFKPLDVAATPIIPINTQMNLFIPQSAGSGLFKPLDSTPGPITTTDSVNAPVDTGQQPVQPVSGGQQSIEPVNSGQQPVQPVNAGQQSVQPVSAGQQAIQPVNSGQQPVQPVSAGQQSVQPVSAGQQTAEPVNPAEITSTAAGSGAFQVWISSLPSGAAISVDGADNGNTLMFPLMRIIDLQAGGDHTVKVTLSGYEEWTGTVTVNPNVPAILYIQLTPLS